MTCGIYEIVNRVNGKRYVGSSVDIEKRFQTHLSELRRGKHHAQHLQRSYIKYGEENFYLNILLECAREDLINSEQAELDRGFDYNSSPTAQSTLGLKFSPGARERVRQNRINRYAADPQGFSAMMSSLMKGKSRTAEWKKFMSDSMIGVPKSCSQVDNMARARAVLGEAEVLEIRKRCDAGETRKDVDKSMGLSSGQVQRVANRERYKWVNEKAPEGA